MKIRSWKRRNIYLALVQNVVASIVLKGLQVTGNKEENLIFSICLHYTFQSRLCSQHHCLDYIQLQYSNTLPEEGHMYTLTSTLQEDVYQLKQLRVKAEEAVSCEVHREEVGWTNKPKRTRYSCSCFHATCTEKGNGIAPCIVSSSLCLSLRFYK